MWLQWFNSSNAAGICDKDAGNASDANEFVPPFRAIHLLLTLDQNLD